jgi:hypothetical protein
MSDIETEPNVELKVCKPRYALFMETNGKECESWISFIKYDGNEDNLNHLRQQLESVDWYMLEDLSIFEIDIDHLVSTETAKEMTKVDLNSHSYHRKFDGVIEKIDLGLESLKKKKSSEEFNDIKINHIFDQLSYGRIDNFVTQEDVDDIDLNLDSEEEDEGEEEEDEGDEGEEEEEDSKQDVKCEKKAVKLQEIPMSLRPKFARHKKMTRHVKE